MPRNIRMTYEQKKNRWRKMVKGQLFLVHNSELGLENGISEEDGYQTANKWLEKQLQVDVQKKYEIHPHFDLIEEAKKRIVVAQQLGLVEEAESLTKKAKHLETGDLTRANAEFYLTPNSSVKSIWEDRKSRVGKTTTAETAKRHAEQFLDFHRDQARAGAITAGRFGVIRNGIAAFLAFYGPSRGLKQINEQDVKDYHSHLTKRANKGGKGNAASTCWDHFQVFKQFIDSASEDSPDIIPPKNLRSKKFTIIKTRKEPTPFTADEVSLLLANASEKLKTYLLLMLNCGFYQGDVADLVASEIDWTNGRIIRARSKKQKMAKGKSAPIKINWLLWDETISLVKKHGNPKGRLFLNESGLPLVRGAIGEDGNEERQDNIRSAYVRLITKLKNRGLLPKQWDKSLKQLRKTGANILEQSKEHGSFVEMFLDHSSVAKRHYLKSGEAVPLFDAAIVFVGTMFGFSTVRHT